MLLSLFDTPRNVPRTGDDSPASSLPGFAWRMAGWHLPTACVGAVVVTILDLAPLELQRRIVNEVVDTRNVPVLVHFAVAYLALILVHQALKFLLRLYQGWLTESATLYTRNHLLGLYGERVDEEGSESGRAVSIVGKEVEALGGFVGEAISQACANVAMLLGVAGYMLVVEPGIAVFALGVLIPQVLLTPIIQRRLNKLVEERVHYIRDMGDRIAAMDAGTRDYCVSVVPRIFDNRMRYFFWKFLMKSLLNILNSLGPLTVLAVGGYLVIQGETEVGVLVAFLSGFERMASPVRELIGFYRVAAQADVQHRMIADWMERREKG